MRVEGGIIRALVKDKLSLFGLSVIGLALLIAILGSYIRPDATVNANEQELAIARERPGFKASYFLIPESSSRESQGFLSGLFFGGIDARKQVILFDHYERSDERLEFYFNGEPMHSLDISEYALASSKLRDDNLSKWVEQHTEQRTYYLGTDSLGRDLLSRLMAGTIVSLAVGFISVLISLLIGISLGAIAGYYRGIVDSIVMWFINVIWSIPTLLMVIAITLVMGKGFVQVFIAVGLTMWVEVARIVRGQFLALREQAYIEAGRSMGFSDARLIVRHMLPNAMGPVIVISAANFASAILIEAGLSFLGIGTQIPMPSWGGMIKNHYAYITTDMAYLAILPGLCITLLVLAFMLIGNRLRDIMDVKS